MFPINSFVLYNIKFFSFSCRKKLYRKNLPKVSVIIIFHNEYWSTLMRTIYSVLNRSPPELLKEIILVNDCSTWDNLYQPLEDFVAKELPDKVKLYHLKERSGLIVARVAGMKKATGDVLIVLDSHTEANVNWLPPLIEPIAENYRTCVCPFIDVVDWKTFTYRTQDEGKRGVFDWRFYYKRLPILDSDLKHPTEPFNSPVMAGGLFAISSKFFWELGGYDEGLDIWGGEQYELSFKIWQCGGRLVDAPCSRVGHIYRGPGRIGTNPRGGANFLLRNYKRVAEVWMDEYKSYLYERNPGYATIETGDISQQLAVREKLQCKSFDWFMKEIAFDLVEKYPFHDPQPFASGAVSIFFLIKKIFYIKWWQKYEPITKGHMKKHVHSKHYTTLDWHLLHFEILGISQIIIYFFGYLRVDILIKSCNQPYPPMVQCLP